MAGCGVTYDMLMLDSFILHIHTLMRNNDMASTKDAISHAIRIVNTFNEPVKNKILDHLFRSKIELAFHRYNGVHDNLRNVHYMILDQSLCF